MFNLAIQTQRYVKIMMSSLQMEATGESCIEQTDMATPEPTTLSTAEKPKPQWLRRSFWSAFSLNMLKNLKIKIMSKTTKMTLKYWQSLSEGSKRRALTCVFPLHKAIVDMLIDDKPKPKDDPWWKMVWRKVRVPEADSKGYRHYKTVVNRTYIP